MNAQTQTPLERIQKVSKWVRIAYIFLMVLVAIPVFSDLHLLWGEIGYGRVNSYSLSREEKPNTESIPLTKFSTSSKILYTLGVVLPAFFLIKGFLNLYRLFFYYSKGNIFSGEVNRQLRKFGKALVLVAILYFPCELLIIIAFSLVTAGSTGITLNITPFPIFGLVIPLLLGLSAICISLIMDAGNEINLDHELTV